MSFLLEYFRRRNETRSKRYPRLMFFLAVLLSACYQHLPPSLSQGYLPTESKISSSFNTEITEIATKSMLHPADLKLKATPIAEWNGISIMPGAIVGGGDSHGYTFSTNQPYNAIKRFYVLELLRIGADQSCGKKLEEQGNLICVLPDGKFISIIIFCDTETCAVSFSDHLNY